MTATCGSQPYALDADGHWRAAAPPCPRDAVYELRIADGGPYPMCPEHTAWARRTYSGVQAVEQIRQGGVPRA